MKNDLKKCDFCGCEETDFNPIASTNEHNICKSCAEVSLFVIERDLFLSEEEITQRKNTQNTNNLKDKKETIIEKYPKDYKKELDKFVVGQEEAKKILSVSMYNHMARINHKEEIDKSNVLLIGKTGTGKSHLVKTMAKIIDVPIVSSDATSLTAAGYVGDDVENMIINLYVSAGKDKSKTERGIIFIDEVDKIAKMAGRNGGRDIAGESVQQGLLKIIEGTKLQIPANGIKKSNDNTPQIEIDTSNILFIFAGSFEKLREERKFEVNLSPLGSTKKKKKENKKVIDSEDLIKFGMIPEFMGRIHLIAELDDITKDVMKRILTEPKNSIYEQYKKLLKISEVQIEFNQKAINKIVNEAMEKESGARALKSIVEDKMIDFMFNIDEYKGHKVTMDYNRKYIFKIDEEERI